MRGLEICWKDPVNCDTSLLIRLPDLVQQFVSTNVKARLENNTFPVQSQSLDSVTMATYIVIFPWSNLSLIILIMSRQIFANAYFIKYRKYILYGLSPGLFIEGIVMSQSVVLWNHCTYVSSKVKCPKLWSATNVWKYSGKSRLDCFENSYR